MEKNTEEKQRSQALNINMLEYQLKKNLCSEQQNDLTAGEIILKAD